MRSSVVRIYETLCCRVCRCDDIRVTLRRTKFSSAQGPPGGYPMKMKPYTGMTEASAHAEIIAFLKQGPAQGEGKNK